MYRSKQQIIQARDIKSDKANWFRNDGSAAVVNIPATQGQELFERVRDRVGELSPPDGCKVKIQQSYGRSVIKSVMNYNLMKIKECGREQ